MPSNPVQEAISNTQNELLVSIDHVPILTLVDTGAAISIMREDLRRQLHKVLTPPDSKLLRGADSRPISPLGMCSAQITINNETTRVLFTVISNCPHAIILGWDFLSTHAALIDCATGTIALDIPTSAHTSESILSRLCTTGSHRIPPLAAIPSNFTQITLLPMETTF